MPIKLNTASGGGVILTGANTASDKTITVPADDGTMIYANSSGNVGIGTSSPTSVFSNYRSLYLNGSSGSAIQMQYNGNLASNIVADNNALYIQNITALAFATGGTGTGTERARIDSSGRLMVNTTTTSFGTSEILSVGAGAVGVVGTSSTSVYSLYIQNTAGSGASSPMIRFSTSNGVSGTIISTSTSTTYATSSDYRLKENVQPMTGALAKVASLKPVTYAWKADNSEGEGFIAHELQEVCPDAVTGKRDEVDADGNPVYQGIDTSFLVATLTAAIQEQQQMIETLQAKVAALEAK